MMKRLLISAAAVSSLALGGCATDKATNDAVTATAAGAALGAGAGAIAGSVIPGIGTGAGTAIGAGVRGIIDALIGTHTYYHDRRRYCYWIDGHGYAHYDYRVRC